MKLNHVFKSWLSSLNPYKRINTLQKQVQDLRSGIRPHDPTGVYSKNGFNYQYPGLMEALYNISYNSDTLTSIQNALRGEIFRAGFELIEADKTDGEVQSKEENIKTTEEEKIKLLKFLDDINANEQNIMDVLYELEDDLNIVDDMYILCQKTYSFNQKGEIINWDVEEFVRLHPKFLRLVQNDQDLPGRDNDGNYILFCPVHRNQEYSIREEDKENSVCPVCGKKMVSAQFAFNGGGKTSIYYMRGEILHVSKYRPSKRLGYSPVITLWNKTKTLLAEDEYILEYYIGKKSPKSLTVFNTANNESLNASWSEMINRVKEDPHYPFVLGIQTPANGAKKIVEHIDFMRSLDEMQYSEQRNEYRRAIGAVYGVLPVWMGDVSTSGGLNNEGMQITVTNRAVEKGQSVYNNKVFPWMLKQLQITGWIIKLRPNEEQDEMAKLQRQSISLDNGMKALEMGLDAEYDDDTGEVVIKPGKLEKQQNYNDNSFFMSSSNGDQKNQNSNIPTTNLKELSGTPEKPEKLEKQKKKQNLHLTKNRPNWTKFSDVIQKQINNFIRIYKRKPSKKELDILISKINKNLVEEMQRTNSVYFKDSYLTGIEQVEHDLGVNIMFDKIDQNALFVLENQKVLTEAYIGISTQLTKKIKEIITQAYQENKGLSLNAINEQLKEATDIADWRAERIARTEMSKISQAARRVSYKKEDPNDEFVYEHIGPNDNRTSQMSKEVKQRTKGGVKWSDYVAIIKEISQKYNPKWIVDELCPITHPNTRHLAVRVQK